MKVANDWDILLPSHLSWELHMHSTDQTLYNLIRKRPFLSYKLVVGCREILHSYLNGREDGCDDARLPMKHSVLHPCVALIYCTSARMYSRAVVCSQLSRLHKGALWRAPGLIEGRRGATDRNGLSHAQSSITSHCSQVTKYHTESLLRWCLPYHIHSQFWPVVVCPLFVCLLFHLGVNLLCHHSVWALAGWQSHSGSQPGWWEASALFTSRLTSPLAARKSASSVLFWCQPRGLLSYADCF